MCERVTCLTSGSGNQRQNAMLMILLTQFLHFITWFYTVFGT